MSAYNILSQNAFWRINKAITRHFDCPITSMFLSFLVDKEQYHRQSGTLVDSEGEEWFYASSKAIHAETCIKHRQQKKAIKNLIDSGFIQIKVMGLPATVHFSIEHNYIVQFVQTSLDKTYKLDCTKRANNNKNKVNKNKEESFYEKREKDSPELSTKQKAEKFISEHTPPRNGFNPFTSEDKPEWGGGTEDDYLYIYSKIADHLNSNPKMWAEVASLAHCKMTPDQFKTELESWTRHYLTNRKLFNNPVQQLRGGYISFYKWLKYPKNQEKYNPSYTDNNQQRSTEGTRRTVR